MSSQVGNGNLGLDISSQVSAAELTRPRPARAACAPELGWHKALGGRPRLAVRATLLSQGRAGSGAGIPGSYMGRRQVPASHTRRPGEVTVLGLQSVEEAELPVSRDHVTFCTPRPSTGPCTGASAPPGRGWLSSPALLQKAVAHRGTSPSLG